MIQLLLQAIFIASVGQYHLLTAVAQFICAFFVDYPLKSGSLLTARLHQDNTSKGKSNI
ncbi:MAG: hypothetical protein FWH34_06240 [Desulfovibrionaceae bacterium]|nr:hypothetical protein [Desulfovibrionaceae bacterium]